MIHPNAHKLVSALDHLMRARASLMDCLSGPGDALSTPEGRRRITALDDLVREVVAELHACTGVTTPPTTVTGRNPTESARYDTEWYRARAHARAWGLSGRVHDEERNER